MIALRHEGDPEDYITAFVDLQYQVSMHNIGLDEVFFVEQFISGLKAELRAGVQSQLPKKTKKAILLAKVQQLLLDNKYYQQNRYPSSVRSNSSTSKSESKSATSTSTLWRE